MGGGVLYDGDRSVKVNLVPLLMRRVFCVVAITAQQFQVVMAQRPLWVCVVVSVQVGFMVYDHASFV